jgi:hypothetical protein
MPMQVRRVITGHDATGIVAIRALDFSHLRLCCIPFSGGNAGSNPVGDANLINNLRNCRSWRTTGYATVELLNRSTMCVAFLFRTWLHRRHSS